MLSEDIRNFKNRLVRYEHTGLTISPGAVTAFLALLEAMELDAVALEHSALSPAARAQERAKDLAHGDAQSNVVPFSIWRDKPGPNNGGAAA